MAVTVTCRSEASVADGPALRVSQTLRVDAYDVIDVTIADAAADSVVEIQPSAAAGQVQLLLVSASQFDPSITAIRTRPTMLPLPRPRPPTAVSN